MVEGFCRADNREEPEPGRVEHEDGAPHPLDGLVPNEHNGGRDHGRGEVDLVAQGDRREIAEQRVPQHAATQAGDHRQRRDANNVEALAGRQ